MSVSCKGFEWSNEGNQVECKRRQRVKVKDQGRRYVNGYVYFTDIEKVRCRLNAGRDNITTSTSSSTGDSRATVKELDPL